MKQTILVTGGAGYIGSHTVLELLQNNYRVIVVDKVCITRINHPDVTYFQCNIGETEIIKTICARYSVDAVIHCAASIEVGASVTDPAHYYDNNVIRTIQLLEVLRLHSINKIIFSSSAAVYGIPHTLPIPETHVCNPLSPYGRTKYIVEQILADYHTAYNLNYVALRYFNAAGAYPEYNLGERHEPETHLIPRMLQAVLDNQPCMLYGNDYQTKDGTCVRDYVHVRDIARAHRLAFEYLQKGNASVAINLGTTTGFSILEIVAAVETVTQKRVTLQKCPRRPGDPDKLIADTTRAAELLSWHAHHSDLLSVVTSAYDFMLQKNMLVSQQLTLATSLKTF